ncbi:MAG: hypothetical protein IJP63_07970 [Acholeplasmatales bacterium]|nr:hypothetical protein [Acholeplasmatales bacterium]
MEETKNEIIEEKEPRTTKQKVFLGLEIAGNVVFYLIIIALFLFALFNINGGNGTENFPNLFGRGMLNVLSDSMNHEGKEGLEEWKETDIKDGFAKGDLLFAKTFSDDDASDLKIGDVIVFAGKVGNEAALITHRIVFITADKKTVVTQGDLAAMETIGGDSQAYIAPGTKRYEEAIASGMTEAQINTHNYILENNGKIENVSVVNIRGIATSVSTGAGKVLTNIQQNYLFYFVIPVAVLLIFEIFLVVRNIMILRGEKNKAELEGTREAMMADVEAEKEKMRQELLAEMRAQGLVLEDTKEEVKEENKVEESTEDKKEEVVETETTAEVVEETNAEEVKEETNTESVEEEKKEETEEETASEE